MAPAIVFGRASHFLCNLCFSLSSTDLWRRGLGRGGIYWEPLSLSLSPLARGEGIQIGTFAKTPPTIEMRPIFVRAN